MMIGFGKRDAEERVRSAEKHGPSLPLSNEEQPEIVNGRSSRASRGAPHFHWNGISFPLAWLARATSRLGRLAGTNSLPIQLGVIVGSVLGMTLVITRVNALTPIDNSASLYLVVVLAIAAIYGAPQAVMASLVSVISYNSLAVAPAGNLIALDPDQWLTLLLLLLVGLVTSHLAGELRRRADEAVRRQHQAIAHARLTVIVAQSNDPPTILEEFVRAFADDLSITGLALLTTDAEQGFKLCASVGTIDLSDARQDCFLSPASLGSPRAASSSNYRSFPLATHDGPGALLIARDGSTVPPLRPDQVQFLEAAAGQFGLAWDRIRLQARTTEVAALRQTDRLKDSFFNAISHDFRTPLAMIKVSAQSLAQTHAAWSNEEHDSFIRTIENNVDRLNTFIQNLLDLSEIEAGVIHPTGEYCSVPGLVDDVLIRLEPLFSEHPVTVEVRESLPAVFVDPMMIDRALSNLIENAVYHTPSGTKLTIRLERHDPFIVVTVADTGPGLPPEVLPYIFDRFYRVRTDRFARRGFGLGLAVAKGMVEAHGGRIWVDGAGRSGTFISFSLPICPGEQTQNVVDSLGARHRNGEETP